MQAEQRTELVDVVSKLAKQVAAAERDAAAAAAKADGAASTNIAGNAAVALQQVHTWSFLRHVKAALALQRQACVMKSISVHISQTYAGALTACMHEMLLHVAMCHSCTDLVDTCMVSAIWDCHSSAMPPSRLP